MAPQAARPLLANQSRALQLATGWFVPTGATVQWPPDDLVWDETTATSDYSFPEPNYWVWLQCVRCRQGALRLAMLPTARACPVKHGSNPFGEGPGATLHMMPPHKKARSMKPATIPPKGTRPARPVKITWPSLRPFSKCSRRARRTPTRRPRGLQPGGPDSNQEDQEDSNQPPSTS